MASIDMKLDKIYDEVSELRADLAVIKSKISTVDKNETRIRCLEDFRNQQIGAVTIAGVIGGLLASLVMFLVNIIVR